MSIFRKFARLQLRKQGRLGTKYKSPAEIRMTKDRIKQEQLDAKRRKKPKRNTQFQKRIVNRGGDR